MGVDTLEAVDQGQSAPTGQDNAEFLGLTDSALYKLDHFSGQGIEALFDKAGYQMGLAVDVDQGGFIGQKTLKQVIGLVESEVWEFGGYHFGGPSHPQGGAVCVAGGRAAIFDGKNIEGVEADIDNQGGGSAGGIALLPFASITQSPVQPRAQGLGDAGAGLDYLQGDFLSIKIKVMLAY